MKIHDIIKHTREANLNKLKNVGEDYTRTTATVNNGNRTFRKHIQKAQTQVVHLTKVPNNGTTTKRFVRPCGSGTQTTVISNWRSK